VTDVDAADRDGRYEAWVRRTELPLIVLALLFLVVFVVPLYAPDLPPSVQSLFSAVNVLIWVAFAVDYVMRLKLAPDPWQFVRRHIPDVLVLALPLLRPLRLLRLVGVFGATTRRAGGRAQVRTTTGVVAAVVILVVVAGGLVLDAERGHDGANIVSASDALWWASTTVTTVGYGDRFPTTGEGRLVGVLLMVGGIALLGVVTASIAAWFVRRFTAVEQIERAVEAEGDQTARLLADLAARLDRMERLLADARRPGGP
jgi:voltage-gated potassium channel